MTQKINFTLNTLRALPNAKVESRDYYYDKKTPNLGIMVFPSGTKTFFLYKRINNMPDKVKLGRFGEMTPEQARAEAYKCINEIQQGLNPNKRKKALRAECTFAELFQKYLNDYAKVRKKTWIEDANIYKRYLTFLDNRKLSSITRQDIEKIHNNIKTNSGLYAANRTLALIKTFFNKALHWGFNGVNPANGVKRFQEKARDRALQPHEIHLFFEALSQEPNELLKAYFYISLLTGARKGNILSMKWENITFGENSEWSIPDTKNGESHIIALVPQAVEILIKLKLYNLDSSWVFPSKTSKSGHIEEPKKAWQRILVKAGIKDLRIHDLRRTLASWQVRTGANSFIIGKTLGHKNQQATAVYARVAKDITRDSMEKAVNAMLGYKPVT